MSIHAFPRPASLGNNYVTGEEGVMCDPQQGMMLRDWFAGQALAGEMAAYTSDTDSAYKPNDIAKRMYDIADAMIAQRSKS